MLDVAGRTQAYLSAPWHSNNNGDNSGSGQTCWSIHGKPCLARDHGMSEFGSEPRSGNQRRKHFDFSRVVKVEAGSKSRARLFLYFYFYFFNLFVQSLHAPIYYSCFRWIFPVFSGSLQQLRAMVSVRKAFFFLAVSSQFTVSKLSVNRCAKNIIITIGIYRALSQTQSNLQLN